MKRRDFIRGLLAMGLMSPALKALSVNLTPVSTEKQNLVAISGEAEIEESPDLEIMDAELQDVVIKVIGVGDCGGKAVDYMIEHGVRGVEFIAINTDAKVLRRNRARTQLQIGATITNGLGAGAIPDVGRAAAEEDRARIAELISDANMVFIIAGMGGGTGAAPVVAQIAKEMDILSVALVILPFDHEIERLRLALIDSNALRGLVDSLIIVPKLVVVPRNKLVAVLDEDILADALSFSNSVIQSAVAGIAEVINVPGLVGIDFADVRMVLSGNGMATVGSASASGPDRAKIATENALASPLLEDVNLAEVRGVLVNISSNVSLTLKELRDVAACVQFAAEEATVIVGVPFDEGMGDELRVTIVATGPRFAGWAQVA